MLSLKYCRLQVLAKTQKGRPDDCYAIGCAVSGWTICIGLPPGSGQQARLADFVAIVATPPAVLFAAPSRSTANTMQPPPTIQTMPGATTHSIQHTLHSQTAAAQVQSALMQAQPALMQGQTALVQDQTAPLQGQIAPALAFPGRDPLGNLPINAAGPHNGGNSITKPQLDAANSWSSSSSKSLIAAGQTNVLTPQDAANSASCCQATASSSGTSLPPHKLSQSPDTTRTASACQPDVAAAAAPPSAAPNQNSAPHVITGAAQVVPKSPFSTWTSMHLHSGGQPDTVASVQHLTASDSGAQSLMGQLPSAPPWPGAIP